MNRNEGLENSAAKLRLLKPVSASAKSREIENGREVTIRDSIINVAHHRRLFERFVANRRADLAPWQNAENQEAVGGDHELRNKIFGRLEEEWTLTKQMIEHLYGGQLQTKRPNI